jgi:hypothetical protein
MPWTNIDTNQNAGWVRFDNDQPGNWSGIEVRVPLRFGVSGVGVSEAAVSGSSDSPPDWTLIETQ